MKLFIATPSAGGEVTVPYDLAIDATKAVLWEHGIAHARSIVPWGNVATARNLLIAEMMASPHEFTHILFIDSDIAWKPADVLRLIAAKKDVICAAYPKKTYPLQFPVNFLSEEVNQCPETGAIEIKDAPAGFMLISRAAIERMIAEYPELRAVMAETQTAEQRKFSYALFGFAVELERAKGCSEDFVFCRRWREAGGQIWADPEIELSHYGQHEFKGKLSSMLVRESAAPRPAAPRETGILVSVSHPTARTRPSAAFVNGWREAMEQWFHACDHPERVEYVISVHHSRIAEFWRGPLSTEFPAWGRVVVTVNYGDDTNCAQVNNAARATSGKLYVGTMDDLFAPEHWDTLLLDAVGDLDAECVIHCPTGVAFDDQIINAGALTRARYERFGYIIHPSYSGMAAEHEFTELAYRDGVVIKRPDIVFDHQHCGRDGRAVDEIYERHTSRQEHVDGLALLNRRRAQGFPKQAVCVE